MVTMKKMAKRTLIRVLKALVYGGTQPGTSPGIHLGDLALRGEKGVLLAPADDMLRLRGNPFYSYLESAALGHLQLAPP